ncbi:MAG: hypothetical protein A2284_04850 [Deltaproteobacteria bacterium RIFOXYA12_FULL_61_11]|nr:MAG: hypothetical protein A2284_04850 [Deltaproteobacteria bacterium RIFOXYA12_FULL_61_11]
MVRNPVLSNTARGGSTKRILIVDDEEVFARALRKLLEREGYLVECCHDGITAYREILGKEYDLVLCDYLLPHMTGLELLKRLRAEGHPVTFMMMTAYGSVEAAVEAVNHGAKDFLVKSMDLPELIFKVRKNLDLIIMERDLSVFRERQSEQNGFRNLLGECPAMQAVFCRIREVAETENTTVLIQGESGTGKELVARAIHDLSPRSKRPLVALDCTTMPANLLESELFGYERGAFTDASRTKPGMVEAANGGTLFLDEIGDLEAPLQAKLLRLVQERTFRRLGGTRDLRVDVRFMAATNNDLHLQVERKLFREDLYYRLKVFTIDLPPLRQRDGDVMFLARRFLEQFNRDFRRNLKGFSAEAERFLTSYPFPGNVRELRNIIEQAVILAKGEVLTFETPRNTGLPLQGQVEEEDRVVLELRLDSGQDLFEHCERALVDQAMIRASGNRTRAAQLLGISRHAFKRRLEKFGLEG